MKPTDSLRDDLGCDSLDLVEISMLLEEQFEIEIPDDFGEEIDTITQVSDGVTRLLQPPPHLAAVCGQGPQRDVVEREKSDRCRCGRQITG